MPRPIVSIAAIMRPSRPSRRSASETIRIFGVAVGEASPQRLRDAVFVAMRIERANARESAGGGTADAHIAMHHQRRAAVPATHKSEHIFDMGFARHDVAVERLGNIMHLQPEMVFRSDIGRPFEPCLHGRSAIRYGARRCLRRFRAGGRASKRESWNKQSLSASLIWILRVAQVCSSLTGSSHAPRSLLKRSK